MSKANQPPLRLAFAGTPHFAAKILAALIENYPVVVVYCQPARPSGRGQRVTPSPVEVLARSRAIEVYTPKSMRTEAARLTGLHCDALVVAAYGKLLPKEVLNIPRYGCINVHASLLPRWRGAAPIERAMLAGDATTGISIMQMDEGLDTGSLLAQVECPILDADTGDILHDRLAELGATALIDCLQRVPSLTPRTQDPASATYASKLTPEDSRINWSLSAGSIAKQIRALNSRQPTVCRVGTERVRLLFAEAIDWTAADTPGRIIRRDGRGLIVACGVGAICVTRLALSRGQGKSMDIRSLMNGYTDLLIPGQVFDAAE